MNIRKICSLTIINMLEERRGTKLWWNELWQKISLSFTKSTCKTHLGLLNFMLHFKMKNMVKRTSKNSKSWELNTSLYHVTPTHCKLLFALQLPMMQDTAPEGQRHGRGYDGKASYEDLQTQWILRGSQTSRNRSGLATWSTLSPLGDFPAHLGGSEFDFMNGDVRLPYRSKRRWRQGYD